MKAPSLYFQTIRTSWGDNPIRFGPWSQPYFMELVPIGDFVLTYLPNPTSYGHDTYTIGYSKDWGLRGCVEIFWQPHWIWSYSYELVKLAMFHGFGSGGLIRGAMSPEPDNLWTWDHWIQQRLKLKVLCRNTVTTPSDLELWTRELSTFHGFGLGGSIRGAISPEPYNLWIRDLHHWIQQRLRFITIVEILWQPHKLWSYEPLNSTMFHWFGLHK